MSNISEDWMWNTIVTAKLEQRAKGLSPEPHAFLGRRSRNKTRNGTTRSTNQSNRVDTAIDA